MSKVTERKGIGWFKDKISIQNQPKEIEVEIQITPNDIDENQLIVPNELKETINDSNKVVLSKENQDKLALDVINSMENLLKDRQLLLYKNRGLEEQIQTANDTINRLNLDFLKRDQLLIEKEKDINELESKLTTKQMSYDQLIEDYKNYQLTSNLEYEKISNQLETETAKYNKLNEDFTNYQYKSVSKMNDFEERIRNLEIENKKYIEQYQKIVDEKAKLMETISDFTERMSFSLSAKTSTPAKSEE